MDEQDRYAPWLSKFDPSPQAQYERRKTLVETLKQAAVDGKLYWGQRHYEDQHCAVGWCELLWAVPAELDPYVGTARLLGLQYAMELAHTFDRACMNDSHASVKAIAELLEVPLD